mgnify:CR=1 FL=1
MDGEKLENVLKHIKKEYENKIDEGLIPPLEVTIYFLTDFPYDNMEDLVEKLCQKETTGEIRLSLSYPISDYTAENPNIWRSRK